MMEAKIVGVNLSKGRVVALTSGGGYVLLELLSDEVEMHDIISGNFDLNPLGSETVRNLTSDTTAEFFVQDYCDKSIAEKYLRGLY